LKDLKKRELIEQFEKILMVIFFSSGQSVYFNQFFLLKNTLRCWTSNACTQTWHEAAEFV